MSGNKLSERMNITLKTGEWWAIPWWRDEKYFNDGFASRESAEIAFCELIRAFDAKWMLGQKTNGNPPFLHPIAIQLMTEEPLPFQFLCELGINLHTVRITDLLGDIERRLKNPKEYWESAAFELKLLSCFLSKWFKVDRHHLSGKGRCNCDLKVSRGSETVFLEIKRPKELSARNQQIISKAQSIFYTKLLNDDIKNEGDFTSSPLSSSSEVEKVFRLIRYAVNKQIPKEGPGIVAVESPHALDWKLFEIAAEKRFVNRKKYSHLSAIFLFEVLFSEGCIRHSIKIILNRQAKIDVSSYTAIKAILSLDNSKEIS